MTPKRARKLRAPDATTDGGAAVSTRATSVTPERLHAFFDLMLNGGFAKASCDAVGMSWRTFQNYLQRHPEAFAEYQRVKAAAAELDAEKAVEVLLTADRDTAQLAQYTSQAYRWRAKVRNPRLYADRMDVTSAGEPVRAVVQLPPVDPAA